MYAAVQADICSRCNWIYSMCFWGLGLMRMWHTGGLVTFDHQNLINSLFTPSDNWCQHRKMYLQTFLRHHLHYKNRMDVRRMWASTIQKQNFPQDIPEISGFDKGELTMTITFGQFSIKSNWASWYQMWWNPLKAFFTYHLHMNGPGRRWSRLHTHPKSLFIVDIYFLILFNHGLQQPTVHVGPIFSITPRISILRPLGFRHLFSLLGEHRSKHASSDTENVEQTENEQGDKPRNFNSRWSNYHTLVRTSLLNTALTV